MTDTAMKRWAVVTGDEVHRLELGRSWSGFEGPMILWVMLNPSTADGNVDDPTVRRCIGFSKLWGFGSLVIVNLVTQRATDPRDLDPAVWEPMLYQNKLTIQSNLQQADMVVVAWGAGGERLLPRVRPVVNVEFEAWRKDMVPRCLGVTKHGHPRHPLYVPKGTPLEQYVTGARWGAPGDDGSER